MRGSLPRCRRMNVLPVLGDALQKGGPDYGFRLRLSAPRPDFELRVAPAELDVRAGTSVPLTVYAIRKDGFAGDIALT